MNGALLFFRGGGGKPSEPQPKPGPCGGGPCGGPQYGVGGPAYCCCGEGPYWGGGPYCGAGPYCGDGPCGGGPWYGGRA
ncbi:hypothetical protein E1218_33455 [Kribbella turkmenica]|uniref:Uncharacterized protein n=1 Tax=Kribbella turkmenica TaxID=2530375 RepID=A0A4R4WFD0_9ACTN|nr:hypothetical protein E1218_33455 [Kribbella turkmenica]